MRRHDGKQAPPTCADSTDSAGCIMPELPSSPPASPGPDAPLPPATATASSGAAAGGSLEASSCAVWSCSGLPPPPPPRVEGLSLVCRASCKAVAGEERLAGVGQRGLH